MIAFSPNEHLLASGGADTTIRLWHTFTGKQVHVLKGHTGRVNGIAFSPDGKRLASGSADGIVLIWDTTTGRKLFSLQEHQAPVKTVAFSRDGRLLYSGSEDMIVHVWNVDDGPSKNIQLEEKDSSAVQMAFSPTGDRIACNLKNPKQHSRIAVYSCEPGSNRHLIDSKVISANPAISPDGKMLACGLVDDKEAKVLLEVWNIETSKRMLSLDGHQDVIASLTFSPDGKQLASASDDQTIKLWDVTTGKEIATLHEEHSAFCLAFSPDGLRLASGSEDGTVKIWSVPGRAARSLRLGPGFIHVAFSPDGKQLVGSGDGACIWDVKTGKVLESLSANNEGTRMEWSPDGRYVGCCSPDRIWDAVKSEFAPEFKYLKRVNGYACAFSRDGKLVAATCIRSCVQLWNRNDGRLLRTFQDKTKKEATCVAFSPDSRFLAAGWARPDVGINLPGILRVWDLTTGQEVSQFQGIRHGIWKLAFSPNGKQLAAAIGSFHDPGFGVVKLWDTTTWAEITTLRGYSTGVWSLSFSPDGKRLATASGIYRPSRSGQVKIWDTITWHELITLEDPAAGIIGVDFSPDGRRLATASRNGTVKNWDGTSLAAVPTP